jgi:hypothetical protein
MLGSGKFYDRIMGGLAAPPAHISTAISIIARIGWKDTNDPYDWLPTETAYQEYVKACGLAFAPLEIGDFGFALHLAFPEAERCRRRRAVDGRSMRGWACITGPGAERSTDSDQWRKRRPQTRDDSAR